MTSLCLVDFLINAVKISFMPILYVVSSHFHSETKLLRSYTEKWNEQTLYEKSTFV